MGGTSKQLSRLKRFVGLSNDEQPAYRCNGCGTGFQVQYHVCPGCGGFRVEPTTE